MPAANLTIKNVRKYPEELTEADWKKEKGRMARFMGETGLGAAMRAAKTAFDKLKWLELLPRAKAHRAILPSAEVKALQAKFLSQRSNLLALQKNLVTLETLAVKTAAKYGKNPLMPSDSLKHINKVAALAKQLRKDCDPALINQAWVLFEGDTRDAREDFNKDVRIYQNNCTVLETFASRVKAEPTAAVFNAGLPAVREALGNIVELGQEWLDLGMKDELDVPPSPGFKGALTLMRLGSVPNDTPAEKLAAQADSLARYAGVLRAWIKPLP